MKGKLFENGLGFTCIWHEQNKTLCVINICRSLNKELQIVNGSSRRIFYKHIVERFTLQNYLSKSIPSLYKKQISRIRPL